MSKSKKIVDALFQIGTQSKDFKIASEKTKKWIAKQSVDHEGGYVSVEDSSFRVTSTEMGYLVSRLDWKKDKVQEGCLIPTHNPFGVDWQTHSKVVDAWKKMVEDFMLSESSMLDLKSKDTSSRSKNSRSTR